MNSSSSIFNSITSYYSESEKPKFPIRPYAIKSAAKLQKAIRQAKIEVQQKDQISPQGTSLNQVYNLGSAFFKIGKGNEAAAGAFETFIWHLAGIFEVEELFVPTSETKIQTKSLTTSETEFELQWNHNYELIRMAKAQNPMQGSIQPTQKGLLLKEYQQLNSSEKITITKPALIKALFVTVLFGMFDVNPSNVFITKNGNIKFFDNTRSLPNSNFLIEKRNGNCRY